MLVPFCGTFLWHPVESTQASGLEEAKCAKDTDLINMPPLSQKLKLKMSSHFQQYNYYFKVLD